MPDSGIRICVCTCVCVRIYEFLLYASLQQPTRGAFSAPPGGRQQAQKDRVPRTRAPPPSAALVGGGWPASFTGPRADRGKGWAPASPRGAQRTAAPGAGGEAGRAGPDTQCRQTTHTHNFK